MTDHKNIIKNLTETEAQEYADIELAEELNISDSYVRDVLAGRRWDLRVIEGLISIAKKNMNRALKAEAEIKKLVAQKKEIDSGK